MTCSIVSLDLLKIIGHLLFDLKLKSPLVWAFPVWMWFPCQNAYVHLCCLNPIGTWQGTSSLWKPAWYCMCTKMSTQRLSGCLAFKMWADEAESFLTFHIRCNHFSLQDSNSWHCAPALLAVSFPNHCNFVFLARPWRDAHALRQFWCLRDTMVGFS